MADPPAAFVALLLVHLHFPHAASLKGKRKDLQSVKAQLRTRHGAAVSEVAHQETWQRSTLAAAVVAETPGGAHERADHVERWLESRVPDCVRVERTVASFEELVG